MTDAVGTVDVTVINNEENIFICPSTVSFAAGEKTAKLTVEAPSAAEGITYNLQLALSGNDVSNYSSGYHEISVNFAILKWESIGTGYYLDGTVSNFFKVDPSVPMAVEIEKLQLLPVHVSVLTVRLPKLRLHKMRLVVSTVIPLMKRLM